MIFKKGLITEEQLLLWWQSQEALEVSHLALFHILLLMRCYKKVEKIRKLIQASCKPLETDVIECVIDSYLVEKLCHSIRNIPKL